MVKFGIGCFVFGFKTPVETSLAEYKDKLKEALERISNISAVDITISSDYPIVWDERVEPINDSGIGMNLSDINITFSLHIPFRVQKELFDRPLNCGVEDFVVEIEYGFHGPFTTIVPVGCGADSKPSDAVICVREFLRKNFSDDLLRFENLGPSPFHANFVLSPGNDDAQENLVADVRKKKGYDEIRFLYPPSGNSEDAFSEVLYELSSELSLFYNQEAHRSYSYQQWDELQKRIDSYLSIPPKGFVMESIRNLKDRHTIDALIVDLAKFKFETIQYSSYIQMTMGNIYDGGAYKGYLKLYNEGIRPIMEYHPDDVVATLKFISERRNKSYEILIGLLSGLCGGIIGSLLMILSS